LPPVAGVVVAPGVVAPVFVVVLGVVCVVVSVLVADVVSDGVVVLDDALMVELSPVGPVTGLCDTVVFTVA
jgi:hypothetical protein